MKQTVADGKAAADAVVFECDLPQARDKVWRALTDRELLAAWLMPNDIRPEVGAKFQLRPGAQNVPPAEPAPVEHAAAPPAPSSPPAPMECEILEAEPGRILRWRQREPADAGSPRHFIESVVSFELADSPDGGTHLRVVHDGFTTVVRCSTVVALRPRAQAGNTPKLVIMHKTAIRPTVAVAPHAAITLMSCSLRRAA
jgi:uncharacterized protein YndB with AHSA1/START domain